MIEVENAEIKKGKLVSKFDGKINGSEDVLGKGMKGLIVLECLKTMFGYYFFLFFF